MRNVENDILENIKTGNFIITKTTDGKWNDIIIVEVGCEPRPHIYRIYITKQNKYLIQIQNRRIIFPKLTKESFIEAFLTDHEKNEIYL